MTTTAMRTRITAYCSCIRFPARNVMLPVAGVNCNSQAEPVPYDTGIRHWLALYDLAGDCFNCWLQDVPRYINLDACHYPRTGLTLCYLARLGRSRRAPQFGQVPCCGGLRAPLRHFDSGRTSSCSAR
jgi:hypothetical protein